MVMIQLLDFPRGRMPPFGRQSQYETEFMARGRDMFRFGTFVTGAKKPAKMGLLALTMFRDIWM
jgi:hypothetical protein